jgi:hypothetical protein
VFVELMPLLAGRTVLITVAKVDDKTLRVNVIPTQAKADENPALSTPLKASRLHVRLRHDWTGGGGSLLRRRLDLRSLQRIFYLLLKTPSQSFKRSATRYRPPG